MSPLTVIQHPLFDHFDFLRESHILVRLDSRIAAATIPDLAQFRLNHIGTSALQPTLGALLDLWRGEQWMGPCPKCNSRFYVVSVLGSPFSNAASLKGYCQVCRQGMRLDQVHPKIGFPKVMQYYKDMRQAKTHSPKPPEFEPGKKPRFDWAEGSKGTFTPPRLIRSGVLGVPFSVALDLLKKGESEVLIRDASKSPIARVRWETHSFSLWGADNELLFQTESEDYTGESACKTYRWDGATLWEARTGTPLIGWDGFDPQRLRDYRDNPPRPLPLFSDTAIWWDSDPTQRIEADAEVPLVALLLLTEIRLGKSRK